MSQTVTAYLGLGANLEDPVESIIGAREQLSKLDYVDRCKSSSLYWSSPVGYSDQPAYINCALALRLQCGIEQLFHDLQQVETVMGRVRNPLNRNAPRTIDIDLLLFDNLAISTTHLTVPHPRLLERRFVVEPLLEIDPAITIRGDSLMALYQAKLAADDYSGQEIFKLGR